MMESIPDTAERAINVALSRERHPMLWAVGFFTIALLLYMARDKATDDGSITGSPVASFQTVRIARAIARAEGFFTDSTLLQRLKNPVGLKDVRTSTLRAFETVEDGWGAAYRQIELILNNVSQHYNRDMSIAQIAPIWTGGDKPEAWASIVSRELGVDQNTPIYRV